MLGSSWVGAQLAASQEGLSSISKYWIISSVWCRTILHKIAICPFFHNALKGQKNVIDSLVWINSSYRHYYFFSINGTPHTSLLIVKGYSIIVSEKCVKNVVMIPCCFYISRDGNELDWNSGKSETQHCHYSPWAGHCFTLTTTSHLKDVYSKQNLPGSICLLLPWKLFIILILICYELWFISMAKLTSYFKNI
jgi:hypothetical protein